MSGRRRLTAALADSSAVPVHSRCTRRQYHTRDQARANIFDYSERFYDFTGGIRRWAQSPSDFERMKAVAKLVVR